MWLKTVFRITLFVSLGGFPAALAGQHHGDFNYDGSVDGADFLSYSTCMTRSGQPPAVGCWVFDFDTDVDIDLSDFGAMQRQAGATPSGAARIMGVWQGTGQSPGGACSPAALGRLSV